MAKTVPAGLVDGHSIVLNGVIELPSGQSFTRKVMDTLPVCDAGNTQETVLELSNVASVLLNSCAASSDGLNMSGS